MERSVLRWLGFFLCVIQVNSMSLKGRALTRYDPCGLGVVHFDKITDKLWLGVVNLGLYPTLKEATIELNFENPMTFYGVSQNSTLSVNNGLRNYILKPKGDLPLKYFIYLLIKDSNNSNDTPVVKNFKLNNMSLCNESIKISQTAESLNKTTAESTTSHQVCGRRSIDHTELTSVRTDSKSGDWPWHAAILATGLRNKTTANYQCGGNIVSSTAILTAGHCMFLNDVQIETDRIIIVAGTNDLRNMHHEGRQSLPAVKVIIHPGYSRTHATSDLAIVIVKKLLYTEYVQPICIWGPVYDKTKLYGQDGVITGFGTTENDKLSNTLRSSYTRVQNDSTCIAYLDQLYSPLLNEFTFCAGDGPKSGINPRNGDSGGGFVVGVMQQDHKISWFLRGILSKCVVPVGQTLCDPKYYVVYTNVGPHYGWIYHNAGLNFKSHIIK